MFCEAIILSIKFADGRVLAFDQTLGNTGISLIEVLEGKPAVCDTWHIKRPADGLTGFQATFSRAEYLRHRLGEILTWSIDLESLDFVVYEMPAVMGYRTESSLLAAYVLQTLATDLMIETPMVMVSNQHAKKVVLGNARIGKKEVRPLIENLIEIPKLNHPWNEHVADATMLGLAHLHDLTEGGKK